MKEFEEFKIVVRRLDNHKEARISLPNVDLFEELEIALITQEEEENGDEIFFEKDELEIVEIEIEDTSGLFDKFSLSKDIDIDVLNSIAEQLTEFGENEVRKILAINEAHGLKLEELLDIDLDDYILHENKKLEDYYYTLVEDGYYSIERLINYIDFESFSKDQNATYDNGLIETEYGLLAG